MKRLGGSPGEHYRTTDHSGEIAWLRLQGVTERDKFRSLAYLAAAEALEGHDQTGWSLDNWQPMREFVEFLLGEQILENGV